MRWLTQTGPALADLSGDLLQGVPDDSLGELMTKDRLTKIRETLEGLEKLGHNCDWGLEADLKWCVLEIDRLRAAAEPRGLLCDCNYGDDSKPEAHAEYCEYRLAQRRENRA